MDLNRRLPQVDPSRFAMVPKPEIPRSTFLTTSSLKTTFDAGYLVPIYVKEIIPGDSIQGRLTIFARLSTLLFPVMDDMEVETFFFFVPYRILWTHWVNMMGQRNSPADSISFTTPQVQSPSGGWAVCSLYDYMGVPVSGQIVGGSVLGVSALPFRAYNLIWNEWFRDENIDSPLVVQTDDGPDVQTNYSLQRRRKRPDYFTTGLPWPLKGGVDLQLPLSGTANVLGLAAFTTTTPTAGNPTATQSGNVAASGWPGYYLSSTQPFAMRAAGTAAGSAPVLAADMSTVTGATINALRTAFQTQRLLERDARSGTRYTELLRAHFGVLPEDARLQRPEYIGGGRASIATSAIPQTSATGLTGGSSPLGALGATATAADQHSFSYHATEHGCIIGIANVRAAITYQQGLHRMWTRSTRYDYYWPVFAYLGEQAIRNDEIYCQGNINGNDTQTFAYQERWAEYRYDPSRITGLFRSTSSGTIDPWHLSQKFTSLPGLNATFIADTPPLSRVLAAGAAANNMQIIWDSLFSVKMTRPMPMFSVPGQLDRF